MTRFVKAELLRNGAFAGVVWLSPYDDQAAVIKVQRVDNLVVTDEVRLAPIRPRSEI